MNSVINISPVSYSEKKTAENWAGEYAKRSVSEHKIAEILDHPDGSVTYDKLSGEIKERFSINEQKTDILQERIISSEAKAVTAQNNAVTATVKAENAQNVADIARTKSEDAISKAEEAKATAEFGLQQNDSLLSYLEQTRSELNLIDVRTIELENNVGDIDTALDNIIAIQNELMGVSE